MPFSNLRKKIPFVFNCRLFIYLFFSFIAATVIGTLSHECGHYLVAKGFGYDAIVHYQYTIWNHKPEDNIYLKEAWIKYRKEIDENKDFPGRKEFDKKQKQFISEECLIDWGGPIKTMLTGTIGLFLLLMYRKKYHITQRLNIRQWILVFITLFWLWQSTNMIMWFIFYFINGKFSAKSDEIILAIQYHLPKWAITVPLGIAGLIIGFTVLFGFIPKQQRFTFILSGLAGGAMGYVVWLELLGKIIMP